MVSPKITEIFSSIQGEGIYAGQPQIFIRFAKCNLGCAFCDTVKKNGKAYSAFQVLDMINRLNISGAVDTVAITGGEPLLYVDFLTRLLPILKKRNLKVYLETNGTLPSALEGVLRFVDTIAMDIKLPSGQKVNRASWARHRDFLNLAKKKDVFVKIVVTDKTTKEEIKKAISIVDDMDPQIPLVLQPVTPANRVKKRVSLNKLIEFQQLAKRVLDDVRIIPQIHKALGAR